MVKIRLILVLVVLLIGAASAGQVNETLGPYKVSFSLPIDVVMNTSVEHSETLGGIGNTWYSLYLTDTKSVFVGLLRIIVYNATEMQPLTDWTGLTTSLAKDGYSNPVVSTRTIDKHLGTILVYYGTSRSMSDVYAWGYSLNDANNVIVLGTSLLPWDNGTLQLLKTFHVEKIK